MYNAMTATVQPGNVRFDLMQPAQGGVRELSENEIAFVSGASDCKICDDIRNASNVAIAVGAGFGLFAVVNPGFTLAAGAALFAGAVGHVIAGAIEYA